MAIFLNIQLLCLLYRYYIIFIIYYVILCTYIIMFTFYYFKITEKLNNENIVKNFNQEVNH